ncbi:MAG: hypothetical protein KGP12_12870 [Actinomycetales bacterium]|nr:hypothetical protein [Actinomycetales bacterium]
MPVLLTRVRLVAPALAAACVALSLLGATPARADDRQAAIDALNQALQRTDLAAQSGIEVKQFITYRAPFGLAWTQPGVNTVLRSGSRLRVHVTAAPDGSGYTSVRLMPSLRLIAAGGVDPRSRAMWATVSMLSSPGQARALSGGLSSVTALTGLEPFASYLDDPGGGPTSLPYPSSLAQKVLLPPHTSAGMASAWTTIESIPLADGGTLIRGSMPVIEEGGEEEGEVDTCVRPLVEITVGPDMAIRSSRWRETCPRGGTRSAGTRTYESTAAYGPVVVKGPVSPSRPASSVLS